MHHETIYDDMQVFYWFWQIFFLKKYFYELS